MNGTCVLSFFEDVNLRTRMAGGYTVPHKEDAHLLDRTSMSGALPYGFTRLKAEALLLQHYAEHRQGGKTWPQSHLRL